MIIYIVLHTHTRYVVHHKWDVDKPNMGFALFNNCLNFEVTIIILNNYNNFESCI